MAVAAILIGALTGGLLALEVSIAAAISLATAIVLAVALVVHTFSGSEAAWTRA